MSLRSNTPAHSPDSTPPPPRTYIFTQQHRDDLFWWNGTWRPHVVPTDAAIQIQLPGTPIRWIHDDSLTCDPTGQAAALPRADVHFLGHHLLPNEGRVPGTSMLYVFDYRITGTGAAAICLYPEPVPDSPEDITLPPESPLNYTLTLLVGTRTTRTVRGA